VKFGATAPISGYVLAGGRSSRMGRDKALISLGGKPLIEHAVTKLRRVCADVHILSNDTALAAFAPTVPDIHPGCGPIGGIEGALAHTPREWNLFLPVDLPFLPAAFLTQWVLAELNSWSAKLAASGIRILRADGRPQPGLCLIHRAFAPAVARAIQREEFALMSLFEQAGREASCEFSALSTTSLSDEFLTNSTETGQQITPAQLAARHLWFLNLNTREDLALAEANLAVLDPSSWIVDRSR
jgi:molybdenum cofactor guanylyltransferase